MDEVKSGNSRQKKRVTFFAAWTTTFVALAGSWQQGYSIGSINAAFGPITGAMREFYEYRYDMNVSSSLVDTLWVIDSAAFPFGAAIGSLLVGKIATKFGRLKGLLLGHCFTVLMSLLAGLSGVLKSPEAMILSRLGIGITTSSIGVGITSMYVLEVSSQHLRGIFGSMIGFGVSLSVELSNILGLKEIFGNDKLWPLLLAITGLPSLIFIFLYRFLPESPRKLYIEHNDLEQASIVLKRLRGTTDVEKELEDMRTEMTNRSSIKPMTVLELIRSSKLRRSVIALLVLAAAFQFTGLNAIAFNMNNIFIAAGINRDVVGYFSVGVNGMSVVIHLIFARLTDRYGRKTLLMMGYGIEGISLFLLLISMNTQHLVNGMNYVSAVATLGYFIGFSVGPGPITFMMFSECFDQTSRSAATTLGNIVLWSCFTFIIIITPYMINGIGGYTFLPFGLIAILTAIYIYKYLPETKNMTFTEIQKSFNEHN